MDDVDYEAWSAYLCALLDGAGLKGVLRIADVACGTGNITLRLAKAGHSVTGIDISEDMLEVACAKARRAMLGVPFVRQDMRSLALHKPVDAVICACDGVNYLLTMEDVGAFFAAAHAALRKGGALLFDISSRFKLEHILSGRTMGVDNDDIALLWQNDYNSRVLQMQLTFFVRKGETFERFRETHRQRAHQSDELRAALERAGFNVRGEYGFATRESPRESAERIQFVAIKK